MHVVCQTLLSMGFFRQEYWSGFPCPSWVPSWPRDQTCLSYFSCKGCAVFNQLCPTLCYPMDCSLPGSSVHGDSSGRNSGVGCHALLQGIFPTQGWTQISCIAADSFTVWTTSSVSSVQLLSCVWLFVTLWTAAFQASLSITNSWNLLKLMSIELVMPSNHLILCHPLLLPPSIFPSIRVFSKVSVLRIRWPKYWSFSFSISSSNEYSGLISFRMDWLDLLAVQGTLKRLFQHLSSKASVLQCWAFFIVQLSHPYMTTRKTIALTKQTFVGKIISLLFNMLSKLVITFLPKSKCLLNSWLQSPSEVILETKKRVSHCFPIYLPWSDGTRYHALHFLNAEF